MTLLQPTEPHKNFNHKNGTIVLHNNYDNYWLNYSLRPQKGESPR